MAAEIDQQFIEYIVKTLVNNPDEVEVKRTIDEKGVLLELTVDPQDLGRVIGRGGITAKSIRTLLRALGVKNDARYNLKIVDTNEEGVSAPASDATADSDAQEDTQDDDQAAEAASSEEAPEEEGEPEADEEPEDEEEEEEEKSAVSRHRDDIEDLTDLDI